MPKKRKKLDLVETYNALAEDFNVLAEYIEALYSPFRPSGDGTRGAYEDEAKGHFAKMRKEMQRCETLLVNKIWEDLEDES